MTPPAGHVLLYILETAEVGGGIYGTSGSSIFSRSCQRTEHLRRSAFSASFSAHSFHAAQGPGGRTGQTASDPRNTRFPENHPDRRRNDPEKTGGGNPVPGKPDCQRNCAVRSGHRRRCLYRSRRNRRHPAAYAGCQKSTGRLPQYSFSYFQR